MEVDDLLIFSDEPLKDRISKYRPEKGGELSQPPMCDVKQRKLCILFSELEDHRFLLICRKLPLNEVW